MSRSRGAAGERENTPTDLPDTSAALGYLALVPLLAGYEFALARHPELGRNVAELILSLALRPFGEHASTARALLLALLCAVALGLSFRRALGLSQRLLRTLSEGAIAAVVLGPLLLLLHHALHVEGAADSLRSGQPGSPPTMIYAAWLCGGAAYEEIVFRLGLLSLAYLAARRAALALGISEATARWLAELFALALSGTAFAAAHLSGFLALFGSGGQTWNAAVFTWRLLAGILLGVLFRWRGLGVAAWAHALFDLALVLGAGPGVFL